MNTNNTAKLFEEANKLFALINEAKDEAKAALEAKLADVFTMIEISNGAFSK